MRRLVLLFFLLLAAPAGAATGVVRDGQARFQVLAPTLIRAEYGGTEDRPTQVAVRGPLSRRYRTFVRGGWRVIRTPRMTLRWKRGVPFSAGSLRTRGDVVRPGAEEGNLGGWTRALDNQSGPVSLHDGVLSRAGWFVLDDTDTVLLDGPGFVPRPKQEADWYVFGYGDDYKAGLRALRTLSGPAPLLPRSAFGVWFSRYWPYSAGELEDLVGEFRRREVPLDTLSLDTDFKAVHDPAGAVLAATVAGAPGKPFSWNAWSWNTDLFPDPKAFIDWAHGNGIGSVAVNIHPTIDSNDPRYPGVVAKTGPLATDNGMCVVLQADPTGTCRIFDWTKPAHLDAYFGLHDFTDAAGVDFYWLDWCCDGPQASVPGLTNDTWINSRYAAHQRARGQRWPAFSRIGGQFVPGAADDGDSQAQGVGAFAEHRSTVQFTGDTCATWAMLAFEAKMSASEGNIGLPYVSHDIGSFNGEPVNGGCGVTGTAAALSRHLPDDLYARWVQFGTFQPLDRLHSNHGDRLPWEYGARAEAAATAALRLREALVPYTYTLARRAYDTGLPITGGLYLQWPRQNGAYEHPSQYTYGRDVVVAPVVEGGDPAPVKVWIPPGTWTDWFTGQRFRGPAEKTLSVPLDRLPVLVRSGAIVPTQDAVPFTAPGGADALTLTVHGGRRGRFTLYDDAGSGYGYQDGAKRFTRLTHRGRSLSIAPARGTYPGAPATRDWTVRFLGVARRPKHVRGGTASYDAAAKTLTVRTGPRPVRRATRITFTR